MSLASYKAIRDALRNRMDAHSGFDGWTVIVAPQDLQPEQAPAIAVRGIRMSNLAKAMPGFTGGSREVTITITIRMLVISVGDDGEAGLAILENGLDEFDTFVKSNPSIDGTVDAITGYEVDVVAQREEAEWVTVAEITLQALKLYT